MILINNLKLSLDTDFSNLSPIIANALKISQSNIIKASLYKKSIDARDKTSIKIVATIFRANLYYNMKI